MKISNIKMPAKADLKARTSSINNAFVQAITPYKYPTIEEVKTMLGELEVCEN